MLRLEVSGAVRLIYRSLGVKGLIWAVSAYHHMLLNMGSARVSSHVT